MQTFRHLAASSSASFTIARRHLPLSLGDGVMHVFLSVTTIRKPYHYPAPTIIPLAFRLTIKSGWLLVRVLRY